MALLSTFKALVTIMATIKPPNPEMSPIPNLRKYVKISAMTPLIKISITIIKMIPIDAKTLFRNISKIIKSKTKNVTVKLE